MSKDTGGPAFPQAFDSDFDRVKGMTLRDYFAAKAMMVYYAPGMLGASCGGDFADSPEAIAEWSYRMADAMLKARAK